MTKEQLLKPRWKAIAAFPDNRNYEVGTILDRDWCRYVNDDDESEGTIWKISDFPHLFKKLEWYEERELNEMPLFIKNKTAIPITFTKIDYWKIIERKDLGSFTQLLMVVDGKEKDVNFWAIEPATEEDYLSNLAKLQTANG